MAPRSYVLLSDDLVVKYAIPSVGVPGLRVQLLRISSDSQQETPVVKKEVPRGAPMGKLVFPCGLLNQPGNVLFRMETIDEGKIVAKSNPVSIKWPVVQLHVPLLVETYSADVIVKMETLKTVCSARNPPDYTVTLEAHFLGPAPTSGLTWFHRGVVFTEKVDGWMQHTENVITLGCKVFFRAGFYKIQVKTSLGDTILVESEAIRALWSGRYLLNVPQQAVATCEHDGGVLVVYKYPRCISDRDRIRVFGKVKPEERALTEAHYGEYMFEVRVQKDRHSVKLPCELFPEKYSEICFTYYSTAENGAVFEVKHVCRPRSFDPGGSEGQWGEWSPWSTCSATCGSGVQNRYRLCSATSEHSCDKGSAVDSRICVESPCPESTSISTTADPGELVLCPCGCTADVTDFKRLIAAVEENCIFPVVWNLMSSAPESELELNIVEVNLEDEKQWLAARDGASAVAKILNLVALMSRFPVSLVASHRALRIELHSHNSTLKGAGFKGHLFVRGPSAKSLILADTTIVRVPALSALHLTIVALAALVALAVSVFFGIQQLRTLRKSPPPSLRTADSCASFPFDENGEPNARSYLLLDPATSISEISASPMSQRRATLSNISEVGTSPEDYLQNAFLFRSISSVATATPTATPVPTPVFNRRIPFSPITGKRLIAAVSPQVQKRQVSKDDLSRGSPIRMRKKAVSKSQARLQRESSAPLTGSLSEFSINASEDGFEYDYYDYGCHNDPGSFFCADPSLLGWPPFIPIPPGFDEDDEDFPMTILSNLTKEQAFKEDATES